MAKVRTTGNCVNCGAPLDASGHCSYCDTTNTIHETTPALSPEAKENELISLATSLAEKQLREGTATSQVIVHYLKLGTMKESLEKAKLIEENKLLKAKTETLRSAQRTEELMLDAIAAMKRYSGSEE